MFEGNERWKEFQDQLNAKGVGMRWVWEARRDGKRIGPRHHPDVCMVSFIGSGFQPSVLIAVAIDYGPRDGFGLFIDEGTTIAADVDKIATPHPGPGCQTVSQKAS